MLRLDEAASAQPQAPVTLQVHIAQDGTILDDQPAAKDLESKDVESAAADAGR